MDKNKPPFFKTGKELLLILATLTDEQLDKPVQVHNHFHGEWSNDEDIQIEFNTDHDLIDISVDCFRKES